MSQEHVKEAIEGASEMLETITTALEENPQLEEGLVKLLSKYSGVIIEAIASHQDRLIEMEAKRFRRLKGLLGLTDNQIVRLMGR